MFTSAVIVFALAGPLSQEQPPPIEIESRWTEVDGAKVHYFQAGPQHGRPVILLHGANFRSDTWRRTRTIKELARAGFWVLAVDLPGYGRSDRSQVKPDDWLGKLLDAVVIEEAAIVSPSMSGRFALPLLAGRPERVWAFVAVAPVAIPRHQDDLAGITVPTLAIWGERDHVVPQAHADMLVEQLPNARKVIIPNGSHAWYSDDPATFNAELVKFLKESMAEPASQERG